MSNNNEDNRAEEEAKAQLKSIIRMVKALTAAEKKGNETAIDEARDDIYSDPLSIETRSGWRAPDRRDDADEEYRILLCTGGPAVQIAGDLDENGEPDSAQIEYQDWGTPWTPLRPLSQNEEKALFTYVACFGIGGY